MQVILLLTLPPDQDRSRSWLPAALTTLGHDVDVVARPALEPENAAALGYQVAETWTTRRPDVVLAVGWVAGLATQVATREVPVPVLLRLPRPGRSGSAAVTRVERALARSGARLLARSPSELDVLARLGAPRGAIRVLPEAVDAVAADETTKTGSTDAEPVVVATDDSDTEVTAVLEGMAAGRPAVVLDCGILGDLVADHVTGLVVRAERDLPAAVRSLAADGMRREAMGMAAADRVQACFATEVVVETLGRLVDEAGRPAYAQV
ncbi:MAG TPA: glycosyltransferase [Mycobacteriales bacterium]|nr:glycosyltransferase [Mycobacteriales bacterium]